MGVIVRIKSPFDFVYLPDGYTYRTGRQVTLSDAEYALVTDATSRALTEMQTGVPDPPSSGVGNVHVDTDPDGATVLVVAD